MVFIRAPDTLNISECASYLMHFIHCTSSHLEAHSTEVWHNSDLLYYLIISKKSSVDSACMWVALLSNAFSMGGHAVLIHKRVGFCQTIEQLLLTDFLWIENKCEYMSFFFSFLSSFFFYWRKTKCTRDSHLDLFAHIYYQSLTFDVLRLSVIPYSKRLKNSVTHDAHCLAQASSPLEFCNIIAQIIHLFFFKSSFLRRKKWKLEGTDVITESGLRVGDMFGFDNEVAVSTLFFFFFTR